MIPSQRKTVSRKVRRFLFMELLALCQILLIGKNQVMQPGSFFVPFDDNKCGRPYDQNYESRRLFVESA